MNEKEIILRGSFRADEKVCFRILKEIQIAFRDNICEFYFNRSVYDINKIHETLDYDQIGLGKGISFKSNDESGLHIVLTIKSKVLTISLYCHEAFHLNASVFLADIICKNGIDFIFGIEQDYYFLRRQNETDISNFELLLGELPKDNLVIDKKTGDALFINIDKNPGREIRLGGIWLCAAWRIYISFSFLRFLNVEVESLTANASKSIVDSRNEICIVDLYDSPFSSDNVANLLKLKTVKEILKIDWLNEQSLEFKNSIVDSI